MNICSRDLATFKEAREGAPARYQRVTGQQPFPRLSCLSVSIQIANRAQRLQKERPTSSADRDD